MPTCNASPLRKEACNSERWVFQPFYLLLTEGKYTRMRLQHSLVLVSGVLEAGVGIIFLFAPCSLSSGLSS